MEIQETVSNVFKKYKRDSARIIDLLQDLQNIYGYLPKDLLIEVGKQTGAPLNRIYHIVTFYKAFQLKPRGKTIFTVCTGTTCHVKGSYKVLDMLEDHFCIKCGETTKDLKYTIEDVGCVGSCALAPVVVVNGKYHGNMTPDKVNKLLKEAGADEPNK